MTIRIREALPQKWAIAQINLGNAYFSRIRGNREKNLEVAIGCYLAALECCKREDFPELWADIQNNLGIIHNTRICGGRTENLEAAILYYSAALEVRTREAFPQKWIDTQNNLGITYRNRIQGDREENLEVAIHCCLTALEVCKREDFPESWADIYNNLGLAYQNRIKGEKVDNLRSAIHCYLTALEIRTRETLPQYCAETQENLGRAYQENLQYSNAYSVFVDAIDILECLRDEIVTLSNQEQDKRQLAEEWNELYQSMVEVCLTLNNFPEAVEYAELSKTRNLIELIFSRDIQTIFPPEIINEVGRLRDEISSDQYKLQIAKVGNSTALIHHLKQLRQQRNELQDRYLPIGYSFDFKEFQATLDKRTAIIKWYITSKSFETFIITRQSLKRFNVSSSAVDLNALENWASEYLKAYNRRIKARWINTLADRFNQLADILHIKEILAYSEIQQCDRLILIPHRYLHLFPLHALPLAEGEFLCDRFSDGVSYAPSCQLLQLAQKRKPHRRHFNRLFAIYNPTRNDDKQGLSGTELQVASIRQYFDPPPDSVILREQAASKAALLTESVRSAHCLHLGCHGSFNFDSPLESALHLAESEDTAGINADLTLGELFEQPYLLDQCRLVTLSACETGITDPTSISDEYIGLPGGFLYAGSPSVVSTLWAVDQVATDLFMIEFYKNLKQQSTLEADNVAIALTQTQRWLRTLTAEAFKQIVESSEFVTALKRKPENAQVRTYIELIDKAKDKPYPFEKPYYWAAFVATGL